jgi:hypothetical protein
MIQSVSKIFESLSDEQSVTLFTTIATRGISSVELRNTVSLTRKQYYSRLSRMVRVGLIRRRSGKLVVTAFGKIVYKSQRIVEDANNNQWKLKVLDSIDLSEEIPREERKKLLDNLIDNRHLKEILSEGN